MSIEITDVADLVRADSADKAGIFGMMDGAAKSRTEVLARVLVRENILQENQQPLVYPITGTIYYLLRDDQLFDNGGMTVRFIEAYGGVDNWTNSCQRGPMGAKYGQLSWVEVPAEAVDTRKLFGVKASTDKLFIMIGTK